ncbi:MAG TPA: hydantoinase B/oxoprolinase family protein, partial [Sphingomonas sp.]
SIEGDGPSAIIHSAAGDFRNMPIETLEQRTPVIIRRLELGKDSGGDGQYRGGQNVVKEYEALAEMGVTLHFDRAKTPEWGLFGGKDGASPKVTVYNADKPEGFVINKVEQLKLRPGDRFVAETGGGGGYGDPAKRTAERRAADVADGIASVAA